MKELAETDPDTRKALLARAMADIVEEVPVNSSSTVNGCWKWLGSMDWWR